MHLGLLYSKDGLRNCIGYSEADWAGDIDDGKSMLGYLFQMTGAAISWRSKKQMCAALSTAEAEYMALACAALEAIWMRQLLPDLRNNPTVATQIVKDNKSAICLAKNLQFDGRAKHIGIKYHFIQEQVEKGNVELQYCPTEEKFADMLTKGLSWNRFMKLRMMCGIEEMIRHYPWE